MVAIPVLISASMTYSTKPTVVKVYIDTLVAILSLVGKGFLEVSGVNRCSITTLDRRILYLP